MRSTESRAITTVFSVFWRASVIAIAVAEFLEKSPARRVRSVSLMAAVSVADLANEPDSVLFAKLTLGRTGSLPCRASGRSRRRSFIG